MSARARDAHLDTGPFPEPAILELPTGSRPAQLETEEPDVLRSGIVPRGTFGADPLPPGTLVAGRLRVVRLLGCGGMGSVYEVEHRLTRHRRALKVLHRRLATCPVHAARFAREVAMAARVRSRYVVEVHDAGQLPDGTPYALMELLEGETLAARLEREGPFEPAAAVALVAELARALIEVHRAAIVHRDLKPENVFLAAPGVDGPPVRILDFGIALTETGDDDAAALSTAGVLLGTPRYIAPEQATSEPSDARTDIYALGVMLYELLTDRTPFEATNVYALLTRVVAGDAVPLRTWAPHVPPELEALVNRAIARDPATRPPSAAAFYEELYELGRRLGCACAPPGQASGPTEVAGPDDPDVSPDPEPHASTGIARAIGIVGGSVALGAAVGALLVWLG